MISFTPLNFWFLGAVVCAFLAAWTWMVVIVAQGRVRGVCLAFVFTAAAVICFCRGLQVSPQQLFADADLDAIITGAWGGMIACFVILADIYAADRNNRLSFTTMSYEFFHRTIHLDGHDNGNRSAVDLPARRPL